MRIRQSGMILLTTILMMVILTLLVLSLMQQVLLYIKVNNQLMIKHDMMQRLEAVAGQLIHANNTRLSHDCMGLEQDPNQILHQLLERNGCIFTADNQQYYYFIDDLGRFPCLSIVVGDVTHTSRHWLISIASSIVPHAMLQVRIAEPDEISLCEASKEHFINQGMISWRYLP